MLKLTNVQISDNSRIISDFSAFDDSTNRGIRTHNRFGKFFADVFGTGTIKVYIDDKKYYINRGSAYKLLDNDQTAIFKDKHMVIDQIQSIFAEMHGGKALTNGRSIGFKNKIEDQLNEALTWVNDNRLDITDYVLDDAMATIKFLQFINTKDGLKTILKNYMSHGLYTHNPLNFELSLGIAFHYHADIKASEKALGSLVNQFTASLDQLKTDKQKTKFYEQLGGYCIEGKTGKAFIYAASVESKPEPEVELEPFYDIIEKYRLEAHEALEGQELTLDLLATYINEKHGGQKCISDAFSCPDGTISLESAKVFLEYAEVDLV